MQWEVGGKGKDLRKPSWCMDWAKSSWDVGCYRLKPTTLPSSSLPSFLPSSLISSSFFLFCKEKSCRCRQNNTEPRSTCTSHCTTWGVWGGRQKEQCFLGSLGLGQSLLSSVTQACTVISIPNSWNVRNPSRPIMAMGKGRRSSEVHSRRKTRKGDRGKRREVV